MADARHLGTQYLAYVSASLPTDLDEIDDYTLVGQSTGIALAGANESQVLRDKDGSATIAGSGSYTVSGGVNAKAIGDDGQDIIAAAARSKAPIWWLITDGVATHKQFRGTGTVSAQDRDMPDNAAATMTFTLGGGEEWWIEEDVPVTP